MPAARMMPPRALPRVLFVCLEMLMYDCMPNEVQKLIAELVPDGRSDPPPGHPERLPQPFSHKWSVLKAGANEGWIRWKEWIRARLSDGSIGLDQEHRRVPPSRAVPKDLKRSKKELDEYKGAVLLIGTGEELGSNDERCYMNANRVLLRACTVHILPDYSRKMEEENWYIKKPKLKKGQAENPSNPQRKYSLRLPDHVWESAVSYVVDSRLILGDAVMFAFRPKLPEFRQITDLYSFKLRRKKSIGGRVQEIGARQLFRNRLKNYAENIASEPCAEHTQIELSDNDDARRSSGDASRSSQDERELDEFSSDEELNSQDLPQRELVKKAIQAVKEQVLACTGEGERNVLEITFDYLTVAFPSPSAEGLLAELSKKDPRGSHGTILEAERRIRQAKRLFAEHYEGCRTREEEG